MTKTLTPAANKKAIAAKIRAEKAAKRAAIMQSKADGVRLRQAERADKKAAIAKLVSDAVAKRDSERETRAATLADYAGRTAACIALSKLLYDGPSPVIRRTAKIRSIIEYDKRYDHPTMVVKSLTERDNSGLLVWYGQASGKPVDPGSFGVDMGFFSHLAAHGFLAHIGKKYRLNQAGLDSAINLARSVLKAHPKCGIVLPA